MLTWNMPYELIVPTEHCVMALHSIVILALIAKQSQSFCYLDKGFTRYKSVKSEYGKSYMVNIYIVSNKWIQGLHRP